MVVKLGHIEDAVLDDGSLVKGNLYHIGEGDLAGGTAGHLIRAAGTTQRFDLGARLVTGDGRVFRYAYLGADASTKRGVKVLDSTAIGWTTIAAVQAIGDTIVTVGSQTFVEDVLRGGYVCMNDSGDTIKQNRLILRNNAVSSATVTITFDAPLDVALSATATLEAIYSPYRNCGAENNQWTSVIGIPAMNADAGHYIWLQTWGPICLSPGSTTSDPGADAEERQVVFDAWGNLVCYGDLSKDQQIAGFIIQKDSTGSAGPPFIMLQISP